MRRFVVLLLACACGGSPAPSVGSQPSGPPAPLVATPARPDDPIVARVNGKPVYGSCVQIQAARGASKEAALDECIGFELLAQAAEPYATDSEVVLATRTALVNVFIAREYEDKFTRPADFGDFYNRIIERNKARIDHDEARASAYVRIKVARDAPPAEDAAAKALMDELAAALKNERGMTAIHLDELAKKIIGTRATYEFAKIPPYLDNGGLVPEYAKPLFSIPEVGRTWPSAVRTDWGWDVILFSDVIPAEHLTPEQVAERYLPDVKRSYFSQWTQQLAQRMGVTPKIIDENVAALENLE